MPNFVTDATAPNESLCPPLETGDIVQVCTTHGVEMWYIVDEDYRLVNLTTGKRAAWDILHEYKVRVHHRNADIRLTGSAKTWRR